MTEPLNWPLEAASSSEQTQRWLQPASNICLDFHGDPVKAGLVVYSDGNHHMALEASLQSFLQLHPEATDIFYATTPPSVIVNLLTNGQIVLGNLTLSRLPNVFISPIGIMDKLKADGYINSHKPFMQSRGNVLLVRKDNPKNIRGIEDLLRDDVRLFISNPTTEKASYEVYEKTLLALAGESKLDQNSFKTLFAENNPRLVVGERIHHREAPQCLYDDKADVAIIYYHLALRYTRIFPEIFDIVFFGGAPDEKKGEPQFSENNITTTYHIGLVSDGGKWGSQFYDYMFDDTVTRLYAEHGLRR